jgi:hypothetical protein
MSLLPSLLFVVSAATGQEAGESEDAALAAALVKAAAAEAETARTQAVLDTRRPEMEARARQNTELESRFASKAMPLVDWRPGDPNPIVVPLWIFWVSAATVDPRWRVVDGAGAMMTARSFAERAPDLAERTAGAGKSAPVHRYFSREEMGAWLLGWNREQCRLVGLDWSACLGVIDRVPACEAVRAAECFVGPGGTSLPDWAGD